MTTKSIRIICTATACFIVLLSAFLGSCSKDKCKGISCYNGGVCVSGSCSCPTGYSGKHCELSSITYQNNTHTVVTIRVNDTMAAIPVAGSLIFYGAPGDAVTTSATTQGMAGHIYTWAFNDNFPLAGNTLSHSLDVTADYFFLEVSDIDVFPVAYLTVNPGTPDQTIEPTLLPADRYTYGAGYYKLRTDTKVKVNLSNGTSYTFDSLQIPVSVNTAYTIDVP